MAPNDAWRAANFLNQIAFDLALFGDAAFQEAGWVRNDHPKGPIENLDEVVDDFTEAYSHFLGNDYWKHSQIDAEQLRALKTFGAEFFRFLSSIGSIEPTIEAYRAVVTSPGWPAIRSQAQKLLDQLSRIPGIERPDLS